MAAPRLSGFTVLRGHWRGNADATPLPPDWPQRCASRLGPLAADPADRADRTDDGELLCVRRLRLRAPADWLQRPVWQTAAATLQPPRATLQALRDAAPYPWTDAAGGSAAAVRFHHPAECLASAAADACTSALAQRWWWRDWLAPGPAGVLALWQAHPRSTPSAWALLAGRGLAVHWARALGAEGARALSQLTAASFALPVAGPAVDAAPDALHQALRAAVPEADTSGLDGDARRCLQQGLALARVPALWRALLRQAGNTAHSAAATRPRPPAASPAPDRAPAPARPATTADQAVGWPSPHLAALASRTPPALPAAPPAIGAGHGATGGALIRSEKITFDASAQLTARQPAEAPGSTPQPAPANTPDHANEKRQNTAPGHPRRRADDAGAPPSAGPPAGWPALGGPPLQPAATPANRRAAPLPPPRRPRPQHSLRPSADGMPHALLHTRYAGAFHLLNLAQALGLYPDFTRPLDAGLALDPWDFVALIGRRLIGPALEADPLWPQLAHWAGRSPQQAPGCWAPPPDPQWSAALAWPTPRPAPRPALQPAPPLPVTLPVMPPVTPPLSWAGWARSAAPVLRRHLALALGLPARQAVPALLCRDGQVLQQGERITVTMRLDSLPVAVRAAGLDRDLGWLPRAGHDLRYRFVLPGQP